MSSFQKLVDVSRSAKVQTGKETCKETNGSWERHEEQQNKKTANVLYALNPADRQTR